MAKRTDRDLEVARHLLATQPVGTGRLASALAQAREEGRGESSPSPALGELVALRRAAYALSREVGIEASGCNPRLERALQDATTALAGSGIARAVERVVSKVGEVAEAIEDEGDFLSAVNESVASYRALSALLEGGGE